MNKENIYGFLLINKPKSISSHDVVNVLRKITNIKKIGHAGTLDPLAEGLLLLAIGRKATKEINYFIGLDKEYKATLKLGEETDTYDKEGKITRKYNEKKIKKKKIKEVLKSFTKEQLQVPPMFSAKKVKGEKLYKLARQGIIIDRKPCLIKIYKIKFIKYSWPYLKIKVKCSSGTYIRSLAYDIGLELNCGAHLYDLKRTKIGNYKLKNAHKLHKINEKNYFKKIYKI